MFDQKNDERNEGQTDEKQKNFTYGRTEWVIPKRDFDFQAHQWQQYGTQLVCESCSPRHASKIDPGKVLVREDGLYKIIDAPVLV